MILILAFILGAGEVYLLPYDAVEIDIWHQPNLSGKYFIDNDTTLNIPILDKISVTNIPTDSLEKFLRDKLVQYYGDIFVSINVYYRINIFGEVLQPGFYYVKSGDNLANLIAQAGGPGPDGNLGKVRIINLGNERVVNFEKILKSGKDVHKLDLRPGDVVIVPRRFLASMQDWAVLFTVGTFLLQVYTTYLTATQ
jgi:polysaccharide export outer membrane protein